MTLRNAIWLCSIALRMDGARLRTLVALPFRKLNLAAKLECIKSGAQHAVSVKIDFTAVRRLHETKVLFRHQCRDRARSQACMCFYIAP